MKEVENKEGFEPRFKKRTPPVIRVIRRNSSGQEVSMAVGMQGPLLDETEPKFQIKGKPITPLELETTESVIYGKVKPETVNAANRQKFAIAREHERRSSK